MGAAFTLFDPVQTEADLAAVAVALIGSRAGLSESERELARAARLLPKADSLQRLGKQIRSGLDPLGETLCRLRSSEMRRRHGATYTPRQIVSAMTAWAKDRGQFSSIVDPGAGSGRFLVAAAQTFPDAELIAVEVDPLAALILRANITQAGVAGRTHVIISDYRAAELPPRKPGRTLFIGNPPYVRHHGIQAHWKQWYGKAAADSGIQASKLAGLHLHFFLRTLQLGKPGDCGIFITAAEWLDVNYGAALRRLLLDGLGGIAVHAIDPRAMPFADAITTGAITSFEIGKRPSTLTLRELRKSEDLHDLSSGTSVPREALANTSRWSTFIRRTPKPPVGYVELGELCAVHRGQVTGCNAVWIAGKHSGDLPAEVLRPAVTKARDILHLHGPLSNVSQLRKVIDLPADLDQLDRVARMVVERFLRWARTQGAHETYIAQHRRSWWSVGLFEPAPIISTYMARRSPVFVRNLCGARHLNIAHGLYPREPMRGELLDKLALWLQQHVDVSYGRTYAGGLTKFEPRELERVPVPRPEHLLQ